MPARPPVPRADVRRGLPAGAGTAVAPDSAPGALRIPLGRRRLTHPLSRMAPRGFGRYRLVEKIAIGGMAEVWRAKQPVVEGVERDIVIQRILPHFVGDPDFVTMFLNEARVAARFNHSNIAQIYD